MGLDPIAFIGFILNWCYSCSSIPRNLALRSWQEIKEASITLKAIISWMSFTAYRSIFRIANDLAGLIHIQPRQVWDF